MFHFSCYHYIGCNDVIFLIFRFFNGQQHDRKIPCLCSSFSMMKMSVKSSGDKTPFNLIQYVISSLPFIFPIITMALIKPYLHSIRSIPLIQNKISFASLHKNCLMLNLDFSLFTVKWKREILRSVKFLSNSPFKKFAIICCIIQTTQK